MILERTFRYGREREKVTLDVRRICSVDVVATKLWEI